MWSEKDINQLKEKGISIEQVEAQIDTFELGFNFMDIKKPAIVSDGLVRLGKNELDLMIRKFNSDYQKKEILKFVPASGAASRMFKALYEFATAENKKELLNDDDFNSAGYFFKNLTDFAFFKELKSYESLKDIDFNNPLNENEARLVVDVLLGTDGMNYGNLPKGLLKFHNYSTGPRTAVQEHMVEAALYAASGDLANLHFTVSPEHLDGFKEHIEQAKPALEAQYEMGFSINYSIQKPSTDTIAVDMSNKPFRNGEDAILFRPGGHGALIENLNELDADLIFVKNIDNVVPDKIKQATVDFKKGLAGLLLEYQYIIFTYLEKLNSASPIYRDYINEIADFVERKLCVAPPPDYLTYPDVKRIEYLKGKLDRPIRVCGMVKNEGEPGGGPFWATNADGSSSLQIVEGSQIDMNDPEKLEILNKSTHFNPVDLVCAVRDYQGKKYDLKKYIDPATGFISQKSKDGRKLKALELPGLWNGAMSDWTTIFVEVDIITFNPVKTVNDLLRPQHQ